MFRRTLKVTWTVLFAIMILMGLFPKLFVRSIQIPHLGLALMCYVLLSVLYVLLRLYRQGTRSKGTGGWASL